MKPHEHTCNHSHDGNNECGSTKPELQSKYAQAFSKFNLHLHDEIVQEEVKHLIATHYDENNTKEVMTFLFNRTYLAQGDRQRRKHTSPC